ncbi:multidrug effflux MFS transporter [Sansalvadorimonas verongulae]|uniref:multidrug effflux MFS transporter n=1 Tax=Sansalvadorimonas verongulae TaxID=2172824 RepID=UPI0012BC9068|nr:multidrug effflux MFS transporter [Sansalvadorimonas verongulae]MTI15435.1 Bcr/CflA family efflux MFS transporter [Sansalvadorimonas verongulae]
MTTKAPSQGSSSLPNRLGDREFALLAALMMALIAVGIDMMLPALPEISSDLGITGTNNQQMIITALMASFIVGQIIFGPWSDNVGRKPLVILGSGFFIIGGLICATADTLPVMLAGRLVQGLGVAALRILVLSMIRDLYEGAAMARMISLVLSLFVLMPCLAPMIGQITLQTSGWRMIFFLQVIASALILAWFCLRQPETLAQQNKRPFSLKGLVVGMRETWKHTETLSYTLAIGMVTGVYYSYLFSAQQMFHDVFHVGNKFVLYFAMLAFMYGLANQVNARLVMRFGPKKLVRIASTVMIVASLAMLFSSEFYGTELPLTLFMAIMLVVFACNSFLFGNLNSLAMQPLGHMAGMAVSVINLLSGVVAWMIGTYVGHLFNNTVIPFAIAAIICGTVSWAAIRRGGRQVATA